MPVLVIAYGPLGAVPILAVAVLMANASRVAAWWREVDWRACAAYAVVAAPAAALGARTLLVLPPRIVDGALGGFFIGMIFARRSLERRHGRLKRWHLSVIGAPVGFLTGIVVSTGPITTPIFLAYGLAKGAFLGTEAAASLAVYAAKAIVFRSFGALPLDSLLLGVVIGSSLTVGSFVAKRFVARLEIRQFRALMDAVMLISGLALLWAGVRV